MSEHVLVTGGAGFIGSHVADAYVAAGHAVTVLDNLSSGRRENVPPGASFVEADVRSSEARDLLSSGDFTVINHHAAQMDVRVSVADPEFDAQVNILGLLNLLEGGRAGGVRRIVFASSGGVVYGESNDLPHREDARKLPVSPYGVSKLASEFYLVSYAVLHGLEVVALRYANVYGPRQSPHGEAGVVSIFGSRARRGEGITVYGDGSQTRDYVYVGDVARANVEATACTLSAIHTIDDVAYNVGTSVETSVNDLASVLLEAGGASIPIENAPARPGELHRSAVDVSRVAHEWNWRPEVPLAIGLKQTYDWIVEEAK